MKMLSLVTQIQAANSLAAKTTDKYRTARRQETWKRVTEKAWAEHTRLAIETYKKAMGNDWLSTFQIECRLGYSRCSSLTFLRRLHKEMCLIERRNKDDEPVYNRKRGYEYRWVQNGD
jgi:hypothetical protein